MEESKQQLKQQAQNEQGLIEQGHPDAPATATKPVRHYRAYLFQIYLWVTVLGFGALLFYARTTPYFAFDLAISHAIQRIQWGWFELLMQFVTGLGFNPLSILLTGLLIVYLYVLGLRWEALMALFAAAGVTAVGILVKELVRRGRPTPDLVNVFNPLTDYSFPSGHVLHFTAFLGFLAFLVFTLAPTTRARITGTVVFVTLIVLVGISRIYLGQHWTSDVLGAYLLASLWLTLTVYVYRWGKPRFFVHQPAAPEAHPNDSR